jgi:hypothetical protein
VVAALAWLAGPAESSVPPRQLEAGRVISVDPVVPVPGQSATIRLAFPGFAGARAVYLHYGFNGWNVPLSGPGAGSETVTANVNYFKHEPMRAVGAGDGLTYELTLAVPPEARALHFVACWNECGAGQWDNNDRRDYSWPIVFPYIGPSLTWTEATAPDTGIAITFMTSLDEPAWLEIGPTGGPVRRLEDGAGQRHSFVLTDLQPDTRYTYRVGAGADRVSAAYEFKTAPPLASLEALSFIAFNDAQDNGESGRFSDTIAELVRSHADVDFAIIPGDMPWNDTPGDWWTFFDKARPFMARKVVMPAIGNHDNPGVGSSLENASFKSFFALPQPAGEGCFYEFGFGPARFFALDSERMVDFREPYGAQLRWLSDRLEARRRETAAAPERHWTFTYWHIPPFNAGARHWQQQFDFRQITPPFAGVVDWDIAAHEHLGQRFAPIVPSRSEAPRAAPHYGTDAAGGVGFLVVPPSGVQPETGLVVNARDNGFIRDLLQFPDDPQSTRAQAFNGFERIDIDGATIRLRMFGRSPGGSDADRGYYVRDDVTYRK